MILYRCINDYNDKPWFIEFNVTKSTERGHWIMDTWAWPEKERWISSYTKKQYAYDTKKKALIGYIKRKERELILLESRIEVAKRRLKYAKEMDLSPKLLEANPKTGLDRFLQGF